MSEEPRSSTFSCPIPSTTSNVIRLGHGSGGKMTASLIENVFLPIVGNELLNQLDDAAVATINDTPLAITTDAYVVSPIFFPGGDIGSLSIHGTVNDLSMRGARPLYACASFILEEGLAIEDLSRVVKSLHQACLDSGIKLIAADTKVVNKGAADQLFITTCGLGVVERLPAPAANLAKPGDAILISGDIGRHGIAIMSAREGLELETAILSDSAPLHKVVQQILSTDCPIHCLRDITRGGLASVLNELAVSSQVGIEIEEDLIPVHPEVSGVCELLGLDPLYVACEVRFAAIVARADVPVLLSVMKREEVAHDSCVIGKVTAEHPGRVVLHSRVGGRRIVDKLSGEQLPRIC